MDDVDKVKSKLNLVDVIENYIPLKKAGRNFKTQCPFHNEKSASFVVSPERQIWHCFGCAKGGDMFTFVEEFERVDFSESLKILADKAGVQITKTVFKTKKDEKKNRIYEINHLAAQFYHYLLTEHKSGAEAYAYVTEKRGLSPAIISTYTLGFAPTQRDALSQYLVKKKGYRNDELVEAGVSFLRNGRLFDFFINRLIFPILDSRGNIIAFSGRSLTDKVMPKYINTKETPVYVKGDTVFGIYQAKEGIKKEGKVIVVEGEFDVITSFKEGIDNVVAVKGTALTESQIRLLKRFSQKIVFCFDTDPAGTEAQRRSIALIAKEGITASVVLPPEGKDPDELLRENPGLFKKALKEEINIYDFILESSIQKEDPDSVEGKKSILSRTLPYLYDIENEIIKEHYLKKLATLLDTSLESVMKEADKLKSPPIQTKPSPLQPQKRPRFYLIEEHLLTLLVQSSVPKESAVIASSIIDGVTLQTPTFQKLLEFIREYFKTHETFNHDELSQDLPKDLQDAFDLCLLTPLPQFPTEELFTHELEKTAREAKLLSIKSQLTNISQSIKTAEKEGNEDNIEHLQKEFNTLASHFKS